MYLGGGAGMFNDTSKKFPKYFIKVSKIDFYKVCNACKIHIIDHIFGC